MLLQVFIVTQKMHLYMQFFMSSPLVYVPDALAFFTFKYVVACVHGEVIFTMSHWKTENIRKS